MSWPDCFDEWAGPAWRVVYLSVYKGLRDTNPEERAVPVAEEATQSALCKAASEALKLKFPDYPRFLAWLRKVAYHEAMRILNEEAANRSGRELVDPEWLAGVTPLPDDAEERRELIEALRRCLDRLSVLDRKILHDRHQAEVAVTFDQIAAEVDRSQSSCSERARKARESLRRCLSKQGYF